MEGGHAAVSESGFTGCAGPVVFFAVFVISFLPIRLIGVRAEFFPRIIPKSE